MNNDIFESAFGEIDDELIAEAKSPAIRIAARRKKILISTIAACVAAVLVSIPSIKVLSDLNDSEFTTSDDTEIIYEEEIIYEQSPEQTQSGTQNDASVGTTSGSAGTTSSVANSLGSSNEDLTITVNDLSFINNSTNGSTTTYRKVYVPNTEHLYINPIPTDKYVTVYKGYYQKEISQNEAQSLADKYFPKIINALHIPTPLYETEIDNDEIPSITIRSTAERYDFTEYYGTGFSITNMQNRNIISFSCGENPLTINDKTFSISHSKNDTDVLNSISDLKQELFNIFDVSFDSAKVIRHYNNYSFSGPTSLTVYLYNSSAHPLNKLQGEAPYTDYIFIGFDNYEKESTDISYAQNIWYWSFRTENKSHSKPITQKELLPLEKAEEYLNKGYVLSMGGCAQCQAEQAPIDFANYDYVSFEYDGGFNVGVLAIPYYAFYKNIGVAQNGNMIFSKAYVPAIEVEGYEEYFINKHNNHNKYDNSNDYILKENG
ncbi:MAG: hypothetical protein IKU82_05665 [Clostridia bacterium]|nr:hypothetical protein [Clostridia bacterium]